MKLRGSRKWWALGAITLAVLAVGLDGTILNVALPTLASALHASESDLQWFTSGYALMLAAGMLPAGLLGDRFGRKTFTNQLGNPLQTAFDDASHESDVFDAVRYALSDNGVAIGPFLHRQKDGSPMQGVLAPAQARLVRLPPSRLPI